MTEYIAELWEWLRANSGQIGAAAGILGTFAAAAGLIFSAVATSQSTRTTDFEHVAMVEGILRELYAAFDAAKKSGEREQFDVAKNDALNRLETLSAGIRHKLLGKQGRLVAINMTTDTLALLEHYQGLDLETVFRQGKAYEDLRWLRHKYRRAIRLCILQYQTVDSRESSQPPAALDHWKVRLKDWLLRR